jgi:hypothetical protein
VGIVSVFDIDMSENGIDGSAIYLFDYGRERTQPAG